MSPTGNSTNVLQINLHPQKHGSDRLQKQYLGTDILCPMDEHLVWEEWKQCHSLASSNESFQQFMVDNGSRLPWSLHSNHTAVLLEFRDDGPKMAFVVANMMNNLPLHWRVQVLGGKPVCNMIVQLFPHETAAGKVVVTLIDLENVEQVLRMFGFVLTNLCLTCHLPSHTMWPRPK